MNNMSSKIEQINEAEAAGKKALSRWYEQQPKGCTCKGILRITGSDLFGDLSYSPERFNSQGCKFHCDHEGIRSGICRCGKKI
jgi:hypothetical protein